MLRVVGVHGIRNYAPGQGTDEAADALAHEWHEYLRAGPLHDRTNDIDMRIAYYADRLADEPAQSWQPRVEHLAPPVQRLVGEWAADLGVDLGGAQGRLLTPVRDLIEAVASLRSLPVERVEAVVTRFFPEVAAYLADSRPEARNQAGARVIDLIRASHPHVVLAHSLGSVIAYEALQACPQHVPLLITLGSPLAMPTVVYPRLRPAFDGRAHGRPPGVGCWINISDPGDPIAIPRFGVSAQFAEVDLDIEHSVHWWSPHAIRHYLGLTSVATALTVCRTSPTGR